MSYEEQFEEWFDNEVADEDADRDLLWRAFMAGVSSSTDDVEPDFGSSLTL